MKILDYLFELKDRENLVALDAADKVVTYQELWDKSDSLAFYFNQTCKSKKPVIIYGHKNSAMLMSFIASVKSGRAYCPIDISMPLSRVNSIIEMIEPDLIVCTEDTHVLDNPNTLNNTDIEQICSTTHSISQDSYLKEDDTYYIIFTSGSTGVPKGVEISYTCLNNFVSWALNFSGIDFKETCIINQAPFSFDLSVMDLYLSLCSGSRLFMLTKEIQSDFNQLLDALARSDASVWVSTPSFADMCLVLPEFSAAMMPHMKLFLFCGETLTTHTAQELKYRFPEAKVFNTYGPTESTVAVTEVEVTESLLQQNPLPVGRAKPGTEIKIICEGKEQSEGESGEIVIAGNTVSPGYYKNNEMTEKVFYSCNGKRCYRTGDKGRLENGMLYYEGRIDLQVKLHGYRIELEDIEHHLQAVKDISQAVVLPVYDENQKVDYLEAYCCYTGNIVKHLARTRYLKSQLSDKLPAYMVPKKFHYIDAFPMTPNGKINRRELSEVTI